MSLAMNRYVTVSFLSLFFTFLLLLSWELLFYSGYLVKIVPSPTRIAEFSLNELKNFFSTEPNSYGVGIHLYHSLKRVLLGFSIACLIAIPVGIALGLGGIVSQSFYPHINILKQASPLAWLPIGLALTKNSEYAAIFVIAICSVWPIMLNIASAVRLLPKTYYEVASVFGIRGLRFVKDVLLPAVLPQIIGSMRVGFGISWMVIVAAEMLVGNRGIGYFIWNEWNNLNLSGVILAILVIGIVGVFVDALFSRLESYFNYNRRR